MLGNTPLGAQKAPVSVIYWHHYSATFSLEPTGQNVCPICFNLNWTKS